MSECEASWCQCSTHHFNYTHILDEGSDGSLFYSYEKGPVVNQIESLIKIPFLLQPAIFIIEEKIWVKSVMNILWRFYLPSPQEHPQPRGLMECCEGFIYNAAYLKQNNHLEQQLCLI